MADASVNLSRLAIDAALNCQWPRALKYNQELIKQEPLNVDCLNRIAKAHFELGNYTQAKKIYQNVLELDPYNTIAQKNIKKITVFKKNGVLDGISNNHSSVMSPSLFLEEPGSTKVVSLAKLAEPRKLLKLSSGSMVNLVFKNRGLAVTDSSNQYIGALPDDIAFHLLRLIKGGNKYQAIIKSVGHSSITILIREAFRSKKFKNQASFLDEAKVLSYSSDHISFNSEEVEEDDTEPTETEEFRT